MDHGLVFAMADNIKRTAQSLQQHAQMLDDLARSGEEGRVQVGDISIHINEDVRTENTLVAILLERGGEERAISVTDFVRILDWDPTQRGMKLDEFVQQYCEDVHVVSILEGNDAQGGSKQYIAIKDREVVLKPKPTTIRKQGRKRKSDAEKVDDAKRVHWPVVSNKPPLPPSMTKIGISNPGIHALSLSEWPGSNALKKGQGKRKNCVEK